MGAERSGLRFYGFTLLSALFYIYIAYFLERHQSWNLMVAYGVLFLAYVAILKVLEQFSVKGLVLVGIVFRCLLLFSFPNLSDDIYRFVWDGKLISAGIHPFAHLPGDLVETAQLPENISMELYGKLNSPHYYTIYPPVAQFIFWLSTIVSDSVHGSAVFIRSCILIAEAGTLWLLFQLTMVYNIKPHALLIYALNPLVILELTGNLHFEAFMIFFVLLGVYFFEKKKIHFAAAGFGLAIAGKLLPLMFMPAFIRRLGFKKLALFFLITGTATALLFVPLLDLALWDGMGSSISLYFQKFEFNASIYYLVREVGYWVKGYNIIGSAGRWLSGITFLSIVVISLVTGAKVRLPPVLLWVLLVYLLMATTVHPWYITTLIALAVLTGIRFPVLWSGLIFLTYIGYTETTYHESMLVVLLEYTCVMIFMGYELVRVFNNKMSLQ